MHPIVVRGRLVPDQTCPVCLAKKRNDWSFRLRQEVDHSDGNAYFVTLTYDPENLPVQRLKMSENMWHIPNLSAGEVYFYPFRDSKGEVSWNFLGGQSYFKGDIVYNPVFGSSREPALFFVTQFDQVVPGCDSWSEFSTFEPCFSPKDVDRFFRYLRQVIGKGIRYFLVSEYGGEFHRPHYHCILFNTNKTVEELRQIVDKCWHRGRTQVEYVSNARLHYITKYALKDSDQFGSARRGSPLYPFRRFSTGRGSVKGIGSSYIQPRTSEFHINDNQHFRLYVNLGGDRRLRLPRYLKDRIFDDDMRERMSWNQPPFDPLYLQSLHKISDYQFSIDDAMEDNILKRFSNHGKDKFVY